MKNHKACLKLVELYSSYTDNDDQTYDNNFRLWDENNHEITLGDPEEDGDVRINRYDWPQFLSEFNDPLKWLKSLRIVRVTTIISDGKMRDV
jgi:hypothetical protein